MLNFIKEQIISLALGYLAALAQKIPFAPLRDYVIFLTNESKYVVSVLIDANKDDKEQLKEVWQNERVEFVRLTSKTTSAFADTIIKDKKVKYIAQNLISDLEYVLTTGDIEAGSQLEAYVKTLDIS